VMGLLFGVVSTPRAAPIFLVLLTYLAGAGASVPYGASLLLVYALGFSVLILLAGTSMGAVRKLIESTNITKATEIMRRASGGVIILVGAFFVYQGPGAAQILWQRDRGPSPARQAGGGQAQQGIRRSAQSERVTPGSRRFLQTQC